MLWTPQEIVSLTGRQPILDPAKRFAELSVNIADPLAALLWYNLSTYLPDDLLVKTDRMSMAHGLEVRSPFLDTELLEWALRLPRSLQWRGQRGKWLLRQAYRDILPADILNRPKHGFGVPLDAWFRGALRPLLEDLLLPPESRLASWLDRRSVAELCRAHWNKTRNAGHQLWSLLTLELWLRNQTAASIPAREIAQ
jgi:asparagine synthase (glutamine-hydrolysing)